MRDVALALLAAVLTFTVTTVAWVREIVPQEQASVVLTVLTGAAALAGAVLWTLVARLTEDARPTWGGAALAVYGLIAVPATTLGSALNSGRAMLGAVRLSAHATMMVLLLLCCWPAMRRFRYRALTLLGASAGVSVVAGLVAAVVPGPAIAFCSWSPVRWLVIAGWLVAAASIGFQALSLRVSSSFRAALGIALLALAHGYRILTEPAQSDTLPSVPFCALRLLGLMFLLVGTFELARRALHGLGEAQLEHQEELRRAEDGLAKLAERDHELRNGIAGIAGATGLLQGSLDDEDEAALRIALAAEIVRLNALLRHPGSTREHPEPLVCDVSATVRKVAALKQAAGLDVRCEVPAGLAVLGSAEMITQVLVNLFTNSARHAPGSAVLVSAQQVGDRVVVRVSDSGPGVPAGAEEAVFERGTRDAASGGRGLGLYICRELLDTHGGGITVRPVDPARPGCVIEFELPAAVASSPQRREVVGLGRVSSR